MKRDEFSDFGWNSLEGDLSGEELVSDGFAIDLSKAIFESGLTEEQNFEVSIVLQIPNQRCVSDHAMKKAAYRVLAGSSASPAPEIAKEALHDVIGSLRLNKQRSVRSFHGDWIGEELVFILVDLSDQGL